LRIVVERCLYGVDRNPLAVEMAKLSLWLLTLQRNRPFTFLDHAIRCGDSLLGVNLRQLSAWSLSGEGKQTVLFNDDLSFAADKREGLMKMQYRTGDQRRLLDAALARTRRLRAAADRLIATAFEANLEASAAAVSMACWLSATFCMKAGSGGVMPPRSSQPSESRTGSGDGHAGLCSRWVFCRRQLASCLVTPFIISFHSRRKVSLIRLRSFFFCFFGQSVAFIFCSASGALSPLPSSGTVM